MEEYMKSKKTAGLYFTFIFTFITIAILTLSKAIYTYLNIMISAAILNDEANDKIKSAIKNKQYG